MFFVTTCRVFNFQITCQTKNMKISDLKTLKQFLWYWFQFRNTRIWVRHDEFQSQSFITDLNPCMCIFRLKSIRISYTRVFPVWNLSQWTQIRVFPDQNPSNPTTEIRVLPNWNQSHKKKSHNWGHIDNNSEKLINFVKYFAHRRSFKGTKVSFLFITLKLATNNLLLKKIRLPERWVMICSSKWNKN